MNEGNKPLASDLININKGSTTTCFELFRSHRDIKTIQQRRWVTQKDRVPGDNRIKDDINPLIQSCTCLLPGSGDHHGTAFAKQRGRFVKGSIEPDHIDS